MVTKPATKDCVTQSAQSLLLEPFSYRCRARRRSGHWFSPRKPVLRCSTVWPVTGEQLDMPGDVSQVSSPSPKETPDRSPGLVNAGYAVGTTRCGSRRQRASSAAQPCSRTPYRTRRSSARYRRCATRPSYADLSLPIRVPTARSGSGTIPARR
jgi:hypothetical protein